MQDPLSRWLQKLRLLPFVLAMLAASYVVVLPLALAQAFIPSLHSEAGPSSMREAGLLARFFVGCVLAPILETALYQGALIWLLRLRRSIPWSSCLLVSAAAFAVSHTYSVGYVIFAFLVGLVLAYCYALCHVAQRSPFWVTSTVHALRNAIAAFIL